MARTKETAWIQSYCYRTRFDTVAATTQAPNTSATEVPVRRYKPSCNKCFHFGITVKSVGASSLTQCWEQVTTARRQITPCKLIVSWALFNAYSGYEVEAIQQGAMVGWGTNPYSKRNTSPRATHLREAERTI